MSLRSSHARMLLAAGLTLTAVFVTSGGPAADAKTNPCRKKHEKNGCKLKGGQYDNYKPRHNPALRVQIGGGLQSPTGRPARQFLTVGFNEPCAGDPTEGKTVFGAFSGSYPKIGKSYSLSQTLDDPNFSNGYRTTQIVKASVKYKAGSASVSGSVQVQFISAGGTFPPVAPCTLTFSGTLKRTS